MEKYLLITDFDDTLCWTPNMLIGVTNKQTHKKSFYTTEDLKQHIVNPDNYDYDWTQFEKLLPNHKPVRPILNLVRSTYNSLGPKSIVVLTARSNPTGPIQFLDKYGLNGIDVVALGIGTSTKNQNAKADWIKNTIATQQITSLDYYDDNIDYINSCISLKNEFSNVKIRLFHVSCNVPT